MHRIWGEWVNTGKEKFWIVLFIIVVGFLLRIYRIDDQSVWYDEAFSLTVSRLPLAEMTDQLIRDFCQPPLHYYMLHVWFELFGFGAFQARLLSAVFGTLAIVMIYLFARYLFDPKTAFLSAILLAVSQLAVMYSQEARPYALFLFLVLCSSYSFVRALQEKNERFWWGFVAWAILMIYTHYYGVFVVLALFLYGILYRQRYAFPGSWLIGGMVLGFVLYAPWILSGVTEQALNSGTAIFHRQRPWFAAHWWTPMSVLNDFNNGKFFGLLSSSSWWIFLMGVLLFTLPALLSLKRLFSISRVEDGAREFHQDSLVFLAMFWLVPVSLLLTLGATIDLMFDVRYVAFCVAPYYILVARGISQLKFPRLRTFLISAVLIYSVIALRANYFVPYKENYRDALAYVAEHYQGGDYCIFLPFRELPLQWAIYHSDHSGINVTSLEAVASSPKDYNRVWLVTYRRVPWAVEKSEEERRKLETTHLLKEENKYFWVHVALYVPNDEGTAQGTRHGNNL
jgi:mannosyltransferase